MDNNQTNAGAATPPAASATSRVRHWSPSSLRLLMNCGEKYRRRYIEGDRRPSGQSAARGTAIHAGIEYMLKLRRDNVPIPEISVHDATQEALRVFRSMEYTRNAERDQQETDLIRDVLSAIKVYHRDVLALVLPKDIEVEFTLDVEGMELPITGRIDMVEVDGTIRDLKTTGKAKSADDYNGDLQLAIYSAYVQTQFAGPAPAVFIDQLVIGKTGTVRAESLRCRLPDADLAFEIVHRAEKMLEHEVFMPAAIDWWGCSANWCEYFSDCPFGQRRKG